MKVKIKYNMKNGLLVIGEHHIKDEVILDASEVAKYKLIIDSFKSLGWCEVLEAKKVKKPVEAKPENKPSEEKPVEAEKKAPKRRRRNDKK